MLVLQLGKALAYDVSVEWGGRQRGVAVFDSITANGAVCKITAPDAQIEAVYDPQAIFSNTTRTVNSFSGRVQKDGGWGSCFIKLRQGRLSWWQPVDMTIKQAPRGIQGELRVISARTVNMDAAFNDKVIRIFEQQYNAPRWPYPTLQLPVQGIGNWCYPKVKPEINDEGLRKMAAMGDIHIAGALNFRTPADPAKNNILFTSLWDNYPDSAIVPLNGKGQYLALMLCGTTNPMQSQLENGSVTVHYADGTETVLSLTNPDNWWPVEQDYMNDGYAFHLGSPPPLRLHLKDGKVYPGIAPDSIYSSLKGYSNRMIAGGAATIIYMPIDQAKNLQSLTLKTTANEVVMGLMGISIVEDAREELKSLHTIIQTK